ncbi:hypothetical protein B9Z55_007701 [Caenorhabditis nigoni]|uniref:BTB domain-containing protein n=1 Tax=Caenorhabditis nigoni TaxID=1611254 RepID=A0A2G5VAZ0_9PELO|nr:hypothetical protein B9Z55_007701 [Caenorhabditis nigoni]
MRLELIAATTETRKKQEEMLQKFESKTENKIEGNERNNIVKFDELSSRLQSIEEGAEKFYGNTMSLIARDTNNAASSKTMKQFKLRNVFENVNTFYEHASKFSEKKDHHNINWIVGIHRLNNNLRLYLFCEPKAASDEWSIRTVLEFKVVGPNQSVLIRKRENCYQNSLGAGFRHFLAWEDMEKWFLVDGNLSVEVKVTIIETTGLGKEKIRVFDESQKDVSDVILVVGDTKFYVLKMYLAAQSSVFKTLLLGNFTESKQSEVKLSGIDSDDFHYFLEVLYGEPAIDDSNVEDVLLLADMYDAPTAIRKCEEFLLKESEKDLEKKLEIATRCNLEKLKDNCGSGLSYIRSTDFFD